MKKTVVLITFILLLALGLCSCGRKDPVVYSYDYFSEDLSQYISIADSDYKGYKLTVKMSEITEASVDEWIMYTLCQNKLEEAKNPGKTAPLTVGDVLDAWYRPYIIDENGKEVELDIYNGELGKSSINDSNITIGGGSFPVGIESSLVGVVIADYSSMESVMLKEGEIITDNHILYLKYTLVSSDGKKSYSDVRIDLSRTDLDAEFGVGFRAALIGTAMTEDCKLAPFTAMGENGRCVYEDVCVSYSYPKDAKYITVSGTLPHSYVNYDLACGKVYYDIFPDYFTAYDVPEFNDEFIHETLEITDEMLAEYEGDTVVDKYRAYVKAELIRENDEELRSIQEEAMWYHYNDVAEVISYPEDAVLSIYNKYIDEINLVWDSYKDEYSSLDELACAYLSLESGSDWRTKLRADSEAEVKEKLTFYYIIRKENIIPSEEKYKEIFDGLFDEFVIYYMDGATAEDYNSIDSYNKARAEAELAVMEFYGEDFFRHQVYYDYAIDTMLGFAEVEIEY